MEPLSEYREALTGLCREHEVESLFVFGSQATGHADAGSDIDLLVAFKEMPVDRYTDHYFELHEKLEKLFGKPIDLLTVNMLGNPYFIESVERTKQLLYAA
ncbi:MAG: nucleotidyltransferase domain-containing protein [Bacteroidetes bacterium]|nr:MAG: nucleotidyltransferase domain-containing protein [Bacteroidota bacterium]